MPYNFILKENPLQWLLMISFPAWEAPTSLCFPNRGLPKLGLWFSRRLGLKCSEVTWQLRRCLRLICLKTFYQLHAFKKLLMSQKSTKTLINSFNMTETTTLWRWVQLEIKSLLPESFRNMHTRLLEPTT